QALFARRPVFRLGPFRWMATACCAFVVAGTLAVPAGSLVWRTGLKYPKRVPISREAISLASTTESKSQPGTEEIGPRWSALAFAENLARSARSAEDQLTLSLEVAAATALVTVPLAWLLAIIARQGRFAQWLVG